MIFSMKREKSASQRLFEYNDFNRVTIQAIAYRVISFFKLLNTIGGWTVYRNSN